MRIGRTRRDLLRGAGLAALGATAAAASGSAAEAAPAPSTSPTWRIATVTAVRGASVAVGDADEWLPLEGFPDGWQALPGDQVAVAPSLTGKGLSANPLTHWATVVAAPGELRPGWRPGGAAGPAMVAATIVDTGLSGQPRSAAQTPRELRLAVSDRASADGAERIFAVREV